MVNNYSPFIDNRIGTGEAVVFNNQPIDMSAEGFAIGSKTKRAKTNKNARGIQDDLSGLGDIEQRGWLKPQVDAFQSEMDDLIQFSRDPEKLNSDTFIQEFKQKAIALRSLAEQNSGLSKNINDLNNKIIRDGEADLYQGLDEFKSAYNLDIRKLEDQSPSYVNATLQEYMNGLQKVTQEDWRESIEAYPLNKRGSMSAPNKDGLMFSKDTFSIDDDNISRVKLKARSRFISGMKTANGKATVPNRSDKAFYNDAIEFVMNTYPSEVNELEGEEKDQFIMDKAIELYEDEVRRKSKERSESDASYRAPKSGSKDSLAIATRLKPVINTFQDSGDVGVLNKELEKDGARFQKTPNGYVLEVLSGRRNQDGNPVYKPVTGPLELTNADDIYKALSNNIKGLSLDSFSEVDFNDPTPQGASEDLHKEVDDLLTKIFKGYDNDTESESIELIKQFGDDVSYVDEIGGDVIMIGDEEYNLSKENESKEAYDILKERYLSESLIGKAKKLSAKESQKLQEGKTQQERKELLRKKYKY